MLFKTTIQPSIEPVTVAECKLNSRIDGTEEDTLIAEWIKTAREKAENITGRAFINRTLEAVLDTFPEAEILLPVSPAYEVTSVQYINTAGTLATINSTLYGLDTYAIQNWIMPTTEWPETLDVANAVRVTYVAGYGETASSCPSSVKTYIKLYVDTMYKNRGLTVNGQTYEVPHDLGCGLLDEFKTYFL